MVAGKTWQPKSGGKQNSVAEQERAEATDGSKQKVAKRRTLAGASVRLAEPRRGSGSVLSGRNFDHVGRDGGLLAGGADTNVAGGGAEFRERGSEIYVTP